MKLIIDVPEEVYEALKSIAEDATSLDPYSLADIIVNKSKPLDDLRPQGKWIPVSERLPDLYEVVLVTDETGNAFEYERRITDEDGNVYEEWSFLGRKIIAWMPLPDPYRKGGADNDNKV